METIRNVYHVEIDRKKYDYTTITVEGGKTMEWQKDNRFYEDSPETFNAAYHNYQSGWVRTIPRQLGKMFKHDDPISEGVYVYFHHHIQDNVMPIDLEGKNDLNWTTHENIYCSVIDGKIIPTEGTVIVDRIFTEPEETETGIAVTTEKKLINERGVLRFVSDANPELKEHIGKQVMFKKNDQYELLIEGETYFVMDAERVLGTIEK